MTVFEANKRYDKFHFISSYQIRPEALDNFEQTNNIGVSKLKRDRLVKKNYKISSESKEKLRNLKRKLYQTLPNDAKLTNKQRRELTDLMNNKNLMPSQKESALKGKERLLDSQTKYDNLKQKFDKENLEEYNKIFSSDIPSDDKVILKNAITKDKPDSADLDYVIKYNNHKKNFDKKNEINPGKISSDESYLNQIHLDHNEQQDTNINNPDSEL